MEYTSSWGSYPSIYAMGHKAIQDLLKYDVLVEEKIDGSQLSFGLVEASPADVEYDRVPGYALKIRSKGCVMHIDAPEKMFTLAAETVKRLGDTLHPGWTYRGEFLAKPKHNALAYDRVPNGNIIIFDINTGNQEYLSYEDKKKEAERLGLECVPLLFTGRITDVESFRRFLDTTSILGGQRIEGVVVKPVGYGLFGIDKKCLFGKFVSEAYKEVHRSNWKAENPSNNDIVGLITAMYTTPARWQKSVQHLRDRGVLEDSPRDIGPLIKEVIDDVYTECADEIKQELFKHAWGHIRRGLTRGMPEWYKDVLLRKSFETPELEPEPEPFPNQGDHQWWRGQHRKSESLSEQTGTGELDAKSSNPVGRDLVSE